jgi:hypothetical protein
LKGGLANPESQGKIKRSLMRNVWCISAPTLSLDTHYLTEREYVYHLFSQASENSTMQRACRWLERLKWTYCKVKLAGRSSWPNSKWVRVETRHLYVHSFSQALLLIPIRSQSMLSRVVLMAPHLHTCQNVRSLCKLSRKFIQRPHRQATVTHGAWVPSVQATESWSPPLSNQKQDTCSLKFRHYCYDSYVHFWTCLRRNALSWSPDCSQLTRRRVCKRSAIVTGRTSYSEGSGSGWTPLQFYVSAAR